MSRPIGVVRFGEHGVATPDAYLPNQPLEHRDTLGVAPANTIAALLVLLWRLRRRAHHRPLDRTVVIPATVTRDD
jgi:hypothetical protein